MLNTEEKKKYDPKTERGTKGKAATEERKAQMREYGRKKREASRPEREAKRAEEKRLAREEARKINAENFQKCLARMDANDMPPTTAKNTEQIMFTIEIMKIAANADRDNIDTMYQCLQDYIALCINTNHKIGNQAACAACGMSGRNMWQWLQSKNEAKKKFAETLYNICAMYREQLMQDGQINPVTGIFWQKNYDGLRDQQEMILTPNDPLGDEKDAEKIAQKYEALPD